MEQPLWLLLPTIRHGIRSGPLAFLGLILFNNLSIPDMVKTVGGTSGLGLGPRYGILSGSSCVNTDLN